jgi:hypothetical protein
MNDPGNNRPPQWVLVFFRWFCHPDFREDIEGDLVERFHNSSTRLSLQKAKWLFIKDVFLLFRPAIIGNPVSRFQHKIFHMKRINWITLAGWNLLLVVMIVSPFIPGPSNKLVHAFSATGQVLGLLGLLFVPIGLAWTIIQAGRFGRTGNVTTNGALHYRMAIATFLLIAAVFFLGLLLLPNPMPKISFFSGLLLTVVAFALAMHQIRKRENSNKRVTHQGALIILAGLALACLTFICLLLVLALFAGLGIIAGMAGLLVLSVLLFWLIQQTRKLREVNENTFFRLPIYMVTIPVIALLTNLFIVDPASDFSRNYAIKRSQALIAEIEEYKTMTGQYPVALSQLGSSTEKKLSPTYVMGAGNFRYNRVNDQYSISFSQWLEWGSLEEIVLFDKNDLKNSYSGKFAKYDYQSDLCRANLAFANYDAGHKHWRYYHCD